jgi:hypothetical protein
VSDWEQEVVPDPERFPNVKGRDEIIADIARYRRAQATDAEAEAAHELAWSIRGHALATYGRPMAYRYRGTVYGADEVDDEGAVELTLAVAGPDDAADGPPAFDVVDLPDDPTHAMN